MAGGSAWGASTSEKDGVQTVQVARSQPLGFRDVASASPEQPEVTVSTETLSRLVTQVTPTITTVTPDITTVTGTFTVPIVTVWRLTDRLISNRLALRLDVAVSLGL